MEDEIDALFKLPLGEFTPARNALAARLKKAGQPALADAAKALPKPSVAAWVVNQPYWRHREPFDRLIEAGDRFRNSGGMRAHLEKRRNAQAALVPITTAVLHDAAYSDTRNMLRRVTSTLEALSTYGSLPDAPQAGNSTNAHALPRRRTAPAPRGGGEGVKTEKQLAKVVMEADAARERAREAESNVKQATLAAEGAERALELARRKLDQLP